MAKRLRGERGGLSLGLVVGGLVAGALLAIPLVLMSRTQAERGEEAIGQLGMARDAAARVELDTAMRAAQAYYAENGTFEGYGPEVAASYDPSIRYNSSPAAVEGEVSIRGVTATSLVLVTRSPSGTPLCAAAISEAVTYAQVDAVTPFECLG